MKNILVLQEPPGQSHCKRSIKSGHEIIGTTVQRWKKRNAVDSWVLSDEGKKARLGLCYKAKET